MPLLPGAELNRRYRVVSLLAAGRYGATYRAWDSVAGQDVAVKEYRDTAVETQRRFRSAARRLSELKHPQLPQVLDHFALEETGQYLVSRYVDGVDLQSLLDQYGPLPSDLLVPWLQAVCRPLGYLHEQKQLHLDIKPANIRLTPAGELFLVDTGLPALGIRPHASGYGAPEQQSQSDATAAADIYSLGATLYTLLAGVEPPQALERESGLADLKGAREVNANVEPYLSLVASRAMSLHRDARYDTAADFAQALARPSGHPAPETSQQRRTPDSQPAAPPPRLPARTRKQMEQRTIIALSAVLLLILVGMVSFGYLNLERPDDDLSEAEATATFVSAVIAAATQLAPTPTLTPEPTAPPTPTPAPFVSDTGARMIFVPPGSFRMGNNDSEESDEKPSHMVSLDAYFIDETEVTNGQYAQCVAAGVCDPPDRSGATYYNSYYGDANFDDYPVIFVSWYDAEAFCRWRDARLPSEAEWEKAASYDPEQGLKTRYPWGEAFNGQRVNYCDANCSLGQRDTAYDDGYRDTALVGSYPDGRSPVGVYDMAGNVMEWVGDWYGFRYYEESADTNPLGPMEGEFKVIRGGSWLSTPDEVVMTARTSFDPTVSRANLGFRCAMNAP